MDIQEKIQFSMANFFKQIETGKPEEKKSETPQEVKNAQNDDFNVFLFQNVYDVILKKFQEQNRKYILKLNEIEVKFQKVISE